MQLTKPQIQQINTFIKNKGVHWYDVRLEIVDHFANAIEKKMQREADFEKILNQVYIKFGDVKFKKLIKEKTKTINFNLQKSAFTYFKEYFKLPKIILTVILFAFLSKIMLLVKNKEVFFQVLDVLLMLAAVVSLIKGLSYVHNKKQLLAMATVNQLFIAINSFAVIFNSINIFTKNIKSVEFYYFRILIFVLFVLFIITVFHVYSKTLKDIQAQHPELKIS